jgi:proline iminopeptidase
MSDLYPTVAPFQQGMLYAGDGNLVYWETCGNPRGKPAVVFHGGPGSGCTESQRRLFDPIAYRVVLFDQRGCGRSLPHAGAPETDLASNNTSNLIGDIELLRRHLNIDRWLVLGGSWGSTLALAYAEAHPDHVSEIILWGVTTGRHKEFDWLFRGGVALLFPAQWERLLRAVPEAYRDRDLVAAYSRMINDPDSTVRQNAVRAWCMWESATPAWPPTTELSPRFADLSFATAYARLVTHYVRHNAWLEDGILIRNANAIADIPGILVSGRFDFQAPLGWAWELKGVWPRTQHVIVGDAGHDMSHAGVIRELIRSTNHFARQ